MENSSSNSTSTVVCINGSTLSSLLFRLKNSPGDKEGFLVGEVCKCRVDAITDSQSSGTREEKKINILSFFVLDRRYCFYDHYGRPDLTKIQCILESQYKHLIGWFSYRCNTSHRISLREKAVHCKLLNQLTHIPSTDFLFGLLTEELVEQTPIHSTEYSFNTWNGSFRPVGVEVVSLRASGTVPYQTTSVSPDLVHRSEYAAILQSQSETFLSPSGQVRQAEDVESLYRAMLHRLEPLVSELTRSNSELISLHQEVARLQELADELQKEADERNTTNVNSEPRNIENLIDLNSPEHAEKELCGSGEVINNHSTFASRDILSESILEPTQSVQTALLQPSIVDNGQSTLTDEGIHQNTPNSSFTQQSQELF